MKTEINPNYIETKVHCSCGETFTTRSTKPEIKVEICSKCHPFYTGKQKFIDVGGRVERFQKKFDATRKQIAEKEEAAKKAKQEEIAKKEAAKAEFSQENTKEEVKSDIKETIKEEAATPADHDSVVENAEKVSPNQALLDEDAKVQSPENISENTEDNQAEPAKEEESTEEDSTKSE